MARKTGFNYFDCFVTMVEHSQGAAELLAKTVEKFDAEQLQSRMVEMHSIEHSADMVKHDLNKHLAQEFITPIEREDIMELAQQLDSVTDAIEDVLVRMYMYRVKSLRPEVKEFTNTIVKCCDSLANMMNEFHDFRKSATIRDQIVEINRLEEVGDSIYTRAMYSLFDPDNKASQMMVWSAIFEILEGCCDAIEDVADVVEGVMMKNA